MNTTKTYKVAWTIFDTIADIIVVISIMITLFAGLYESLGLILGYLPFDIPIALNVNQALKVALNSVVIVKVYETLKLFISHVHLSLIYIIELGLIGLGVKIFFDEGYMSWEQAGVFAIIFICYLALKAYNYYTSIKMISSTPEIILEDH